VLSLVQRALLFAALGSILLLGGVLFTLLRGSFDRDSLRSLAVLAGVIGLGAVVVALFPDGLAGTVATMAAGGAVGYAVLRVAAN